MAGMPSALFIITEASMIGSPSGKLRVSSGWRWYFERQGWDHRSQSDESDL